MRNDCRLIKILGFSKKNKINNRQFYCYITWIAIANEISGKIRSMKSENMPQL